MMDTVERNTVEAHETMTMMLRHIQDVRAAESYFSPVE